MRNLILSVASSEEAHGSAPRFILFVSGSLVLGAIIWQILAVLGNPNPLTLDTHSSAAVVDISVLVFREGLECVLVLAAISAGMTGSSRTFRNPIAIGAGIGFVATLLTWFVAVRIMYDLSRSISALALQAATGLLAVVVLLIVMNWFFHKIYWTGWISLQNQRKRELLESAGNPKTSRFGLFWGMALLGFASVYREGFEVVLFLQSYRIKLGEKTVFWGVCAGLLLSGIVAVLTFVAHRRLPFRRMLVLTGVLLSIVLFVMVGEQVQEMQLAHWVTTTRILSVESIIPAWMGLWFSVFPTVESLLAQAISALLVLGSYVLASRTATARSQNKAVRRFE
jgi:high-affinity iron transporter